MLDMHPAFTYWCGRPASPTLEQLIVKVLEYHIVPPNLLTELTLDGNKDWTMDEAGVKKLTELTRLKFISMNDCDLQKLNHFPDSLQELEAPELEAPEPQRRRERELGHRAEDVRPRRTSEGGHHKIMVVVTCVKYMCFCRFLSNIP